MTTIGQDIAKAIRDSSRELNHTMRHGITVVEEAGKAAGYLALAVDNLARTLNADQPHDPDDEEPSRQPAQAWPKMNRPISVPTRQGPPSASSPAGNDAPAGPRTVSPQR